MKQIINCTTGEVTVEDYTDEEKARAAEIEEETDRDFTQIRNSRNQRLASSDWTQGADSPLTDAKKTEWATYRQELRDYPSTASKVSELGDWPVEPS